MKTLTRRDFLKVASIGSASAAALLALASCGSKGGETAGSSAGTNTNTGTGTNASASTGSTASNATVIEDVQQAAAETVETESDILDELTIGMGGFYTSLAPVRNGNYQWQIFVRYLFDRVIYRTGDRRYIGQGAKEWSVADDGVTYTVELYDYITDAEGNPVTAEDVVWMIEESIAAKQKACYAKIDTVKVIDAKTFEVKMKSDVAENFEICMASTYLVARKAFEASADGFATASVTTAPYKVTEFVASNSCAMELRDDYWQKEELLPPELKNRVKKLTYKTITEVSQQQIALETGVVDAFASINATIVHSFEENNAYQVLSAPGAVGQNIYCSGHESRPIASDVNLRRAIFTCLDVDGLIKGAQDGRAEPMHDFVPRTSTGYVTKWDNEDYFVYNPEKAKEYLKESNYKGEALILSGGTSVQKVAQLIQGYCLAVGINIELQIEDQALLSTHANDGSTWDLALSNQGNGLINVWTNRFDNTAYAMGDAMSRHDDELQELLEFTWQVKNFTEENIDKVHKYIMDNAYARGLYLPFTITVQRADIPLTTPIIASSGEIDYPASAYTL